MAFIKVPFILDFTKVQVLLIKVTSPKTQPLLLAEQFLYTTNFISRTPFLKVISTQGVGVELSIVIFIIMLL